MSVEYLNKSLSEESPAVKKRLVKFCIHKLEKINARPIAGRLLNLRTGRTLLIFAITKKILGLYAEWHYRHCKTAGYPDTPTATTWTADYNSTPFILILQIKYSFN